MPTIVTKNSSTASDVPSSSDLVQGELAVNVADKRLFTENASATVVEIGTNPSSLTTGVLNATSVTSTGLLTAGGLAYPTSDGAASTVLGTNGSGTLDFISVAGAYDLATQSEAEAGTVTTGKIFSPLRVKQAIDALGSVNWAVPGTIGSTTPNTGAFTNLSASGTFTLGGSAVTSTAAELNILDGVTSTAAELNLVDGSAAGTIANSKALIYGSSGEVNATTFQIAGASITSTAAELNVLDGIPAGLTATELGYVDGVTSAIQTQIDSISPSPTYEATASGTLANGDTVIVNADGTVSAVAGSGATSSLGADQVFNSATSYYIQSCYDTSADRLVVSYKNATDNKITVQVGQISGATITFGSATTVGSAYAETPDIAYDANANRVVLVYRAVTTDYGQAAVGVVTGGSTNTISFGTPVTFWSSGAIRYPAIVYLAATNKMVLLWHIDYGSKVLMARSGTVDTSSETITFGTEITVNATGQSHYMTRGSFYDPDTERVVTCYMDLSDSEKGKAILIENTTGTTLQAGTEYEFNDASTEYIAGCYDTTNDKGVVVYRDKGDSNYLKSRAMTIVGGVTNSITFGTEISAVSSDVTHIDCAFDATASKAVVIYRDATASRGKAITGTISGTGASASSTWDDSIEVSGSSGLEYPSVCYDPDAGKSILLYVDNSNSSYGTANVYTVPFGSTNLTSENYIGISDGAYSSSATATIQVAGAVDDAQSSLTPGQTYYIGFDGSLALTPVDPSVVAGTAVTATKLIVKG
jgi:hypothetical protein